MAFLLPLFPFILFYQERYLSEGQLLIHSGESMFWPLSCPGNIPIPCFVVWPGEAVDAIPEVPLPDFKTLPIPDLKDLGKAHMETHIPYVLIFKCFQSSLQTAK